MSKLCPPIDEHRSRPAAGRARRRAQDRGAENLICASGYRGIIVGIRRDEQATRAKERVFSPRDSTATGTCTTSPPSSGTITRPSCRPARICASIRCCIGRELDIWRYTKRENIPIVPLYLARKGKRYRSLGEKNITFPIASNAATIDEIIAELETTTASERAGRTMDHESEDAFERLRAAGYM